MDKLTNSKFLLVLLKRKIHTNCLFLPPQDSFLLSSDYLEIFLTSGAFESNMHLFLWAFPFIFTIVYSFPQYTNPNQLTENMYLGSSTSQGAWSNPDLQGSIIPASDSIQMYSQQWDMPFPSKLNPIDSSSEISGSTALSASTLNNHSGTQLVNAGNSFLAHSSIFPETGTTSADTSHPDVNFINTPVDSSDETPYNIAFPGTGEGSKSPPNYASSEVPNTEIPKVSSIPPLSHPTPPNLVQNEQVTSIESGDRANVDSNIPTSSGQSLDQALIDGDSPLPTIPFSNILPDIFQPPSFDTPREIPDIDKTPEQQPLYDPEERVANPKRPDCEHGTYAMCCSLGPPRLARTTPVAQVIHRKRLCEICML